MSLVIPVHAGSSSLVLSGRGKGAIQGKHRRTTAVGHVAEVEMTGPSNQTVLQSPAPSFRRYDGWAGFSGRRTSPDRACHPPAR